MHKYGRNPLSGADATSVGQAHRFQPFNPGHKTAFQANKQQQQQPRLIQKPEEKICSTHYHSQNPSIPDFSYLLYKALQGKNSLNS